MSEEEAPTPDAAKASSPTPKGSPPSAPPEGDLPPAPPASLASIEGLDDLEREIVDLLDAPVAPASEATSPGRPGPAPAERPSPPTGPTPFTPHESDAQLREEVVRLRGALEDLRSEILEHRSHIAGFHGQFEKLHTTLADIQTAPASSAPRSPAAGAAPSSPPVASPPTPEARPRPVSAAPVFFLDEQGKKVEAQAFFTLGKGGALERFLTDVLARWETSGFPMRTKGGPDGFSITLEGDPEGRGMRLLPSGMYMMRLGHREMEAVEHLPPLVSSKVWSKSGGIARRP